MGFTKKELMERLRKANYTEEEAEEFAKKLRDREGA